MRTGQTASVARVTAATHGHRRWTVVIPHRMTVRAAEAEVAKAEARKAAQPRIYRLLPQATMFSLIATVASGMYVYGEKHRAATLDTAIAHAFQATEDAHRRTGLLRAEWALLNNPDRLRPMADRYLTLQPMAAAQFVQLADLHSHLPDVLYGPPQPGPADDDAAAPQIAGKRLLAMAETTPQDGDSIAAAPPVVAAPHAAFRVLAHAEPLPDLVGADAPAVQPSSGSGETGLVENQLEPVQKQAQPAPEHRQSVTPREQPRMLVRAEPKLRAYHQPVLLRPDLVHELMLPHTAGAPLWSPPKPRLSYVLALPPQHHVALGRSEPPHDLSLSVPAQPAPRQAPAAYASPRWGYGQPYRRPYWAYNAPQYSPPAYLAPPVPMYPGYQ